MSKKVFEKRDISVFFHSFFIFAFEYKEIKCILNGVFNRLTEFRFRFGT